jgi:hypothetical protein
VFCGRLPTLTTGSKTGTKNLQENAMFMRPLSVVFSLALLQGPAFAADSIGTVVAIVGQPTASSQGKTRALEDGGDVFENDRITVAKGNAQLKLRDGTKLVVGPNSTLLINQFVMRGSKRAEKISIKALRGSYRFFTGNSVKSAYKISTSSATIGIRGTVFDVWVKKKTGAVVFKGAVDLGGLESGVVRINQGCNMGEATTTTARLLTGAEKNKAIRDNLPYIIDQSELQNAFQVNTEPCNIK